jgi:hypothetical protein
MLTFERHTQLHDLSLFLLMAAALAAPRLAIAQTPAPEVTVRVLDPAETEFKMWTLAERLNTLQGYQTYLDMYPNGRYADRVRAAMQRLRDNPSTGYTVSRQVAPSSSGTVAPAQETGLRESPAKLLAGAPRSGAVTQMPGETYLGPGPMTVGYLGAKKQLVLPTGTWVLLAVADRNSMHLNNPVPLVSMVFGQYRAGQLVSFMSYLFNGRSLNAPRGWGDFEDCNNKPPAAATRVQEAAGGAKLCGWTQRFAQTARVEDVGWEAAVAATAKLGAPLPPAPLQFTRAWVADAAGNYLAMRRADFSPVGDSAAVQQARAVWLQAYAPLMLEGFDKKINATELEPEQAGVSGGRMRLPD